MLYMVTTTLFDGAPGFGVFDSYDHAVEAIKEYMDDHEGLGEWENDGGGEWFIMDNDAGYYITFYIEPCYINTPLV